MEKMEEKRKERRDTWFERKVTCVGTVYLNHLYYLELKEPLSNNETGNEVIR